MNPSRNNGKMLMSTSPDKTFFTQTERQILKSVCIYMVGISPHATLDEPLIAIDTFVSHLPKPLQTQLRFGLQLFEWCPILFIGKLCRFTQLSPHEAIHYIETWARSRFVRRRLLFRGLRDIAFLGYYALHPR